MKKLLLVFSLLLSACVTQSLEAPKNFNERVDYLLSTVDGLLKTAVAQRQAGTLSLQDSLRVQTMAERILNSLHRAKEFYAMSQTAQCLNASDVATLNACANQENAALSALETTQSFIGILQSTLIKEPEK